MKTMSGTYTTTRDKGKTYTYDLTWKSSPSGVMWEAKVRHNGELSGTPTGIFAIEMGHPELGHVLSKLIESCIENRVGVD